MTTHMPFGLSFGANDVQSLRATIYLFDQTIFMTRFSGDGEIAQSFECDPASIVEAFSDAPLSTGLLPPDTLFYTHAPEKRIAIYVEPRKHELIMVTDGQEQEKILCALPGMIFAGIGHRWFCYAVKERPVDDQATLYHVPLPNVHTNGQICAGDTGLQTLAVRTGNMRPAFERFMTTAFNGHLVNKKSKKAPDDCRDMLYKLDARRRRKYPLDDLVATRYALKSIMTNNIGR